MGNPKCFLLNPIMGHNTSNTSWIIGSGHFDLSFMEVWILWQSKAPARWYDWQGTTDEWENPWCMKRKTKGHKTPTLVLFIEKKEHRVKERFSCTCRCPRKWKRPGKDHFNYATRWRSCHGAQRPFWERKHLQQHRNNPSWGRFLCFSRSVFGRHFEMGTGTEVALQVNLTLRHRDKDVWPQ